MVLQEADFLAYPDQGKQALTRPQCGHNPPELGSAQSTPQHGKGLLPEGEASIDGPVN